MKKLLRNLSVLCLTFVAFLTTGCYEEEIPFLKVDHEVVLVGPQTDKGTVVVESNVNWTASSNDPWISIDNGFGNHKGTFEFFVAANTTPNERSGKIILTCDNDPNLNVTILVRQQSEGSILTLGTEEITFTKDAGEYLMAVACNGDWKVASSASWCKVDPTSGTGNGSFKISVEENATGADRSAVVSILTEADGKTEVRKVTVFQAASNAVLVVSPESKQLTSAASEFTLDVVTVGSWNASIDSDWLTLSATEGKGDAMLTVRATKNDTGKERIAIITFATGAENENRVIRQIVVRQAAVDFYLVTPITNYPLSLEAQTIYIPYVLEGSNVVVSASSSVDWMTVRGTEDGLITVQVKENGTAQAREGIISIVTHGQEGEPIVRQVRVAQAPTINLLDVLADEYAVEWTGATFRIPIYSNTDVTARSSEAWCTVAVDGSDVVITVPQNDTAAPRVAVVTVTTSSPTGEILNKTTLIHQAAAYSELVVSPAQKNIYSPAQSFIASIVTNNSWTASSDSDWLTIDKAEGTGDYMLTVSAALNATGRVRTATITVETGIENTKRETATITVVQAPEQFFLEVPARYYPLTLEAQTIEIPYSLEGSNTTITASSNVKWMTVASIGDDIVTVNVAENTTGAAREGVISIITRGQAGDPVVAQVVVAQAPTVNILDVLADEYAVEWTGETFRIPMYTNTPVTVRSTDDWCAVSVDGQDIVVVVPENLTAYAREAVVTVTTNSEKGDILNKTFIVRQAAAYSELVVAPESKNIYSDAQSFVASIVTNNTWTASSDSEWLTIDKAEGTGDYNLTVSVAKNETGQARTATITIQTGIENSKRETATITVLQRPEQFYFEVPTRAYLLSKEGQALNVPYTTSDNEKSVTASAGADWVSVLSVADGIVKLGIAENITAETRTTVLTVTCTPVFGEPVSIPVTITQSPTINILDAFVDLIDVMARGDEVSLPYYANTPVSIASSETWCHVEVTTDPSSYAPSGCCSYSDPQKIIKIEVDPNRTAEARVAFVTISTVSPAGEKLTRVITIRQAALYAALSINPQSVVLPAHNGEFTLTINTTGTWMATLDNSWLTTTDDLAGFGDGTIKFTATVNETGADRTGTIVVATGSENNEREEQVVTVIQLERDTYINIPMAAYALTKAEQVLNVGYYAAGDFKDLQVNCSESWIVYDAANSDMTNFVFNVAENTTAEPRTATVTVTIEQVVGEPLTDSFIVTQAPTINILDVYVQAIEASPWGQTDVLPFYGNTPVGALSSAIWCNVTVDDASDPQNVTIVCDKNEDAEARTAYVTLTTVTDKGEKLTHIITVNQASLNEALIVSPEKVVLPAHNASFSVKIGTKSSWGTNVECNWLTPDVALGEGDCVVSWTAADNETGLVREADVIVYTGSENEGRVEKHVQVIQLANDTYLDIPMESYLLDKEAQTFHVTMFAAGDITNADYDYNVDWLDVTEFDIDNNLLGVKVKENTTGEPRTATITVTIEKAAGEPYTDSFTVIQAGTYNSLEVLEDYLVVLTEGETVTLPALTNVETLDKTVSETWVTANVTVDAATKTASVEIVADENTTGKDRYALVTLYTATGKGETIAKTIKVYQPARDILFSILTTDVVYITHDAQDVMISAYANVNSNNITMESTSNWLAYKLRNDVEPLHNEVFAAEENKTFSERVATVKVNYTDEKGEVHNEFVTVVQAANDDYLESLVDYIVLNGNNGEAKTLSFLSNHDVTAQTSSDWITVTATGTDVKIEAPANETGYDRTGYVTVVNDKLKVLVTVFQPARDQFFSLVTSDVLYITHDSQDIMISAYASSNSESITMESSSDWLSYKLKNVAIPNLHNEVFTAAENKTFSDRQAIVKVNYTDDKGEKHEEFVVVVQAANDDYLETLTDYIVLDGMKGEAKTLSFLSNHDVTAQTSSDWITVTATGTDVKIEAPANDTGFDRTGYVTVANDKLKVLVTVFQPARDTYFSILTADVVYIDNTAQDVMISAYASVNSDKVNMESSSSWLTYKLKNDMSPIHNEVFTAAKNEDFAARTATVKIAYEDEKGQKVEKTVTVIQSANDDVLEALVDYIVLDPKQQEIKKLSFISNKDVTALASSAWLTVSATNTEVAIKGEINNTGADRTAYVTVTNGQLKKVVTVFQPAADHYFSVLTPDYVQIPKSETTISVDAYASTLTNGIVMESGANWLAFDSKSVADKVMTYKFKAAKNTTGKVRSADVKISWTNENGEEFFDYITIAQSATDDADLEALVDAITVLADGETVKLTYETEDALTATSSAAWVTATIDGSVDPQVMTVVAAKNETGLDRTAYITVSNGSESVIITVFQPAALTDFAVLSPDVITLTKDAAADVAIKVYATPVDAANDVQFASSASWLTFSSSALSNSVVTAHFAATANTTTEPRTATVKITFVDQKGETREAEVEVFQAAAPDKLIVPVDYLVLAAAGEEKTVAILSEPDATVTKSSTWITAGITSGVVTISATANGTGVDRNGFVEVSNGVQIATIEVFQPAAETVFAIMTPDVITLTKDAAADVAIKAYATPVAAATDVQFNSSESWLTFDNSALSNNVVTAHFKATENTTTEPRTATVKVTFVDQKGATHEEEVEVFQAATVSKLIVPVDYVIAKADGETLTIGTVCEPAAIVGDSSDWITATGGSPFVSIVVAKNETGLDREGYVQVTNGTDMAVIKVFQPAAGVAFTVMSPDVITITKDAAADVAIKAYATPVAAATDVQFNSSESWLTFDNSALSNNVVTAHFKATENTTTEPRTAIVKITFVDEKGATLEDEVMVYQATGNSLFNVPVTDLVANAAGEVLQVGFLSAVAPTVGVSAPAWLAATNAGAYIQITVQPNKTGKDRTGLVQVTDGKEMAVITVFQPAADQSFALLSNKKMVNNAVSYLDITAYCSTGVVADNIKAIPAVSWLSVGAPDVSGSPFAKFTVTVQANKSGVARTGAITVTWKDEKGELHAEDFIVAQSSTGNILDVYVDELAIATKGGEINLPIFTTAEAASVVAKSSDAWLIVSNTVDNIKFQAPENNTNNDRTAIVTVAATYLDGTKETKVIKVTQYGTELYFELPLNNFGVTKFAQTISVDYLCTENPAADIKAYSDVSWITVNSLAGNPLTFNIEANGYPSRTGHVVLYYTAPDKAPIKQTFTVIQEGL